MARYDHFYELPVYKTCRKFRNKISQIIKNNLPKSEEYRLKAQVLDSSRSVTANIAEGFGRFHHQENIQYCRQSRGSLDETLDHMITAFDEKYITKELLVEINSDYKECLKQLNGYIKYLKAAKQGTTNN
ncbi:MAG TPA: four helix bundle protein [Chitinophagaceae bacterium]|nr:four helix bundle protein [Chitinophagaceae bacterium]